MNRVSLGGRQKPSSPYRFTQTSRNLARLRRAGEPEPRRLRRGMSGRAWVPRACSCGSGCRCRRRRQVCSGGWVAVADGSSCASWARRSRSSASACSSRARRVAARSGLARIAPATLRRSRGPEARGCSLWRDGPWAGAVSARRKSDTSEKHHGGDCDRGTDTGIGPLEAVDSPRYRLGGGGGGSRVKPANPNSVVRSRRGGYKR
jgi:hypothetical protein